MKPADPCPFCGGNLEYKKYRRKRNGSWVKIEYYVHPTNDCLLAFYLDEPFELTSNEEIDKWNRRVSNA